MFKFRKEHLEAFERQVVGVFSARAVNHLRTIWPSACNELGEAAVSQLVQRAIQNATKLGLSLEYDVMRYLDLHFILALDFENSPQASWMKSIWSDQTAVPSAKLDRIYLQLEKELGRGEPRKETAS